MTWTGLSRTSENYAPPALSLPRPLPLFLHPPQTPSPLELLPLLLPPPRPILRATIALDKPMFVYTLGGVSVEDPWRSETFGPQKRPSRLAANEYAFPFPPRWHGPSTWCYYFYCCYCFFFFFHFCSRPFYYFARLFLLLLL